MFLISTDIVWMEMIWTLLSWRDIVILEKGLAFILDSEAMIAFLTNVSGSHPAIMTFGPVLIQSWTYIN